MAIFFEHVLGPITLVSQRCVAGAASTMLLSLSSPAVLDSKNIVTHDITNEKGKKDTNGPRHAKRRV